MKQLLNTILLVSVAATLLVMPSCNNDDVEIGNGSIQLSYQVAFEPNTSSSRTASTIEGAANIVVSIEKLSGDVVYSLEELPLVSFEGTYVSSPISLPVGNYVITSFMVTNALNETIYASPSSASELASLVLDPLNITFSVSADNVTNISPEVLSTEHQTPDDFGYPSFGINVVETLDIMISVMRFNDYTHNYTISDGQVNITGDETGLYNKYISPETSQITILDGYNNYEVSVSKIGYETVVNIYTNSEMKAFFNKPLVVEIRPESPE